MLPDNEVIEMLLSKHDLPEMLSSHVAAVALLDTLLSLMATPNGSSRAEELQSLFADVIRSEEENRKRLLERSSAEEAQEEEQMVLGLEKLQVEDTREPLRIQYVRQCRETIEDGGERADAAYGLLRRILHTCQTLKASVSYTRFWVTVPNCNQFTWLLLPRGFS